VLQTTSTDGWAGRRWKILAASLARPYPLTAPMVALMADYYGFAEVTVAYGSPWDNEKRRPYDRFDVRAGLNFGDKTRMGAF
jgi:hypothetical protein